MSFGGDPFGGAPFGGFGGTPAPTPPVLTPALDPQPVRCLLTTLDPQGHGQPIDFPVAELPVTGVTFSLCFNQAAPFRCTLSVEDRQLQNQLMWIVATNPGKTFAWLYVGHNPVPVCGARILGRSYKMSAGTITLSGMTFYSYWTQRLQAQDYTSYVQSYVGATSAIYAWAAKNIGYSIAGAPAPMIAWQLLRDAAAVSGSLPNLQVPAHGAGAGTCSDPDAWLEGYTVNGVAVAAYDPANFVTFSAPSSQQQSIDAMLQQLSGMGLLVGCDIVTPCALDENGNPYAATNVCWPRAGRTAEQLGADMLVIDLSSVLDLDWEEDATSQATALVEMTGAGGVQAAAKDVFTAALEDHHYPLTELAVSHSGSSPTALSTSVLATLLKGDQDLYTYPQLAPSVTVPCFPQGGGLTLGQIPTILGDDIGVFNPFERQSIYGLGSLPFPPRGYLQTMRLVRADVTIVEGGVSTMDLTLNPVPGSPSPPGYS